MLINALHRAGIPARATREPGGSPEAEAIRRLLLEGDSQRWDAASEALLLNAARRDHVNRVIRPALAAGYWVVSDRFADSTLAYQGHGKGVPLDALLALQRFAIGDFAAELTLVFDVPVEIGLARIAGRGLGDHFVGGDRFEAGDRFERLDRAFHERLRAGFREIADGNPGRCVLIDAAALPETVHEQVMQAVRERLGPASAAL